MRKEFTEKLIQGLKMIYKENMNITFKIHPTAEKMGDYEKIILPIDKSIKIIQNENLT